MLDLKKIRLILELRESGISDSKILSAIEKVPREKFIPENLDDLPDNIKVWDERDDVDSFYSACDLFYFASTMECNPLVIKEALSWNMPILMRDLKYLDGMYDDNNNISYIDNNINNSVDAIYKKLNIQTDDKNASSLDIVSSNWMEIE